MSAVTLPAAIARKFAALSPGTRRVAAEVTRSAFTTGLNEILVVSGIGALAAAVIATALIRRRDFVAHAQEQPSEQRVSASV